MMPSELVVCPGCGRRVLTRYGRYNAHNAANDSVEQCFMTAWPIPVVGYSDDDMEDRAYIVAGLAAQVQDGDPAGVEKYLTAVPAVFVQELLQIALGAIDVDGKHVHDIWSRWIA